MSPREFQRCVERILRTVEDPKEQEQLIAEASAKSVADTKVKHSQPQIPRNLNALMRGSR